MAFRFKSVSKCSDYLWVSEAAPLTAAQGWLWGSQVEVKKNLTIFDGLVIKELFQFNIILDIYNILLGVH